MADAISSPRLNVSDVRDRLGETPSILSVLCGGWPDQLWRINEGDGTWSAHEVLCHLIHGEDDDWIPRMRQIIEDAGREPFRPFDRKKGLETYGRESPSRLLGLFSQKRTLSLQTLDAWALDARTLSETGVHPEFGTVTLEQLLATWVTHDFAHVVQIARLAAKYYGGWAGPWRAYFSVFRDDERISSGR